MVIIMQLSVLFGVLFVVSGHNICAAILCHGSCAAIAFVRLASGKSRYVKFHEQRLKFCADRKPEAGGATSEPTLESPWKSSTERRSTRLLVTYPRKARLSELR
jgi:hypothetical protein